MTDLILRIFFSGLIAFVPSKDGKELTILLINESHARHASGDPAGEHLPVMLVRAGDCAGNCTRANQVVSNFFYPEPSATAAAQALAGVLNKGTVWKLDGSDLSLDLPKDGVRLKQVASADGKSVPDTDAERADFRWVASLKAIDPSAGPLDPAIFSGNPPALIAARLHLTSGEFSTHSIVQVNGKAVPVRFQPLSGGRPPYVRAAASWVYADIRIPGKTLKVVERDFKGKTKRTVSLTGLDGVIEMAVLNVTRPIPPKRNAQPQAGLHFDRFWELLQTPPPAARRSIPQPPAEPAPARDWKALHDADAKRSSALLNDIFFRPDRTTYEQVLCPMSQYP